MVLSTVKKHATILVLFLLGIASSGMAEDWPQWRGPSFNGASGATNLPSNISNKSSIQWSVPMPGESSASPVIVGNRVFVVSNDETQRKLLGLCVDLETGKVLWQKLLSEGAGPIPRNTWASCSPVADSERVYFTFGSGLVLAADHDGNEVWRMNLKDSGGHIDLQFGYSSSPTLYKGKLYFPILTGQWRTEIPMNEYHDGDSYLLCLDAETGNVVYRHHRPSDAVGESFDSYTTVVPYGSGENEVIVVQGGDYTTGHDINTGEERWRFADNPRKIANWRLIPSPIVIDELIFNAQPRGGLAYAFNPNVASQKNVESAEWVYGRRTTDVPTPVYYDGTLYVLNGVRKTITAYEPKSGEVLWEGDIPDNRRFWASGAAADDKMYLIDEDGDAVVVKLGKSFEILSSVSLGGKNSKASPALADGKVIFRTGDKLVCLGS